MQQNDTLKKVIRHVCGQLVSLFAYRTYNTLHLATLRENSKTEEKKELLKLSKKMLKIMNKFPRDNIEVSEKYHNMDSNVKIFYEVYNKMEYLTVKELKLLYDFFSILRKQNYFYVIEDNAKTRLDIYNEYSENICNLMEQAKIKRKIVIKK